MSSDCAAIIWTYIGHEKSPSSTVNIRSIETEHYKVVGKIKDEILEEIEEIKAFFQVYERYYLYESRDNLSCEAFGFSSKIAWCQQADVIYYTKTRDYTDIHVIGSNLVQPIFMELLTTALELLSSWHCWGGSGCPNGIQNLACNEYNEVLHKDGTLVIIKGV